MTRSKAQEGIKRAVDHADRWHSEWSTKAYDLLLEFLHGRMDGFTAPEVRSFAYSRGLPVPPSQRAWGGIMARARNERVIVDTERFIRAPAEMNHQPIRVWRVARRLTNG